MFSPPPENCDLASHNFSAIWALSTERVIFAQVPVGWKGATSNGHDNCYPNGGIDAAQEYMLLQKDVVQYCLWNR